MDTISKPDDGFNKIQALVFALFLSCFFLEFLNKHGLIMRQATWLPEFLSIGLLLAIIIFVVPTTRVLNVSVVYVLLFMFIVFSIISGILINQTDPAVIVLGVRTYLKYVPFFLLPLVYSFSDKQIKAQLYLLLTLGLMQLPIALYQRLVISQGLTTGDHVRGTLPTSSYLSIFLICSIVILLAFRMNKRISLRATVILGILLLIPTTINETKGTLVLLPVALFSLVLFAPSMKGKIKHIISYTMVLAVFLAVFIPVYDHFFMPRYGKSISRLFTDSNEVAKLVAPSRLGVTEKRVGRGDKLMTPFVEIKDPYTFLFGLSIGNISDSFFGREFNGEYFEEYDHLNNLAFLLMMYELGIVGTILCLSIWVKVFLDARALSKNGGFVGTFALGWMSVLAILFFSLGYKNIVMAQAVSYIFWFYCGYIASKSFTLRRGIQAMNVR